MPDTVLLAASCFVVGYMIGRLDRVVMLLKNSGAKHEVQESSSHATTSSHESREKKTLKRNVTIDESTYVTDLSTEGIIPLGGSTLGTVTQTDDNIMAAANKLAQLKKLKG